jgi:hypothetical protein
MPAAHDQEPDSKKYSVKVKCNHSQENGDRDQSVCAHMYRRRSPCVREISGVAPMLASAAISTATAEQRTHASVPVNCLEF